jgi:hypothetical protein
LSSPSQWSWLPAGDSHLSSNTRVHRRPELVLVRATFVSLCAHHLLPFKGEAHMFQTSASSVYRSLHGQCSISQGTSGPGATHQADRRFDTTRARAQGCGRCYGSRASVHDGPRCAGDGCEDRDLHDVWPPPGQPCEPCRVPLAGRHQHKVSRDPMMKGAQ